MRTRVLPLAAGERHQWVARLLLAGSLAILGGCSKAEEEMAYQSPSTAALQAEAAQLAIASAQAVHDEQAHRAMPQQLDAGGAVANPADASSAPPATSVPPSNVGGQMAANGRVRLLGQPPAVSAVESLPPAVGAPHLYHLGAGGFFLEQGNAIGITDEQRGKLSAIKQKADLTYAATQRRIDLAENDLWTLTSAESPDATRIEAKISEIGRLGSQQRMDYLRGVGTAVTLLDDAQRKAAIALGPTAKTPAGPVRP